MRFKLNFFIKILTKRIYIYNPTVFIKSMFYFLIIIIMEQTFNSDVITYLVVACVFIFVLVVCTVIFFLKKDKEIKLKADELKQKQSEMETVMKTFEKMVSEQANTLNKQGAELGRNGQYNRAMSLLMLEEQKAYLYNVACILDSFVKKNNLQIEHGFITSEVGRYRNSQLLVLKGSLTQYADSLAVTLNNETVKVSA